MEDNTSTGSDSSYSVDKGDGYGKRPMWQWILLYLVIGAIVYYAIYYFAFAKKGNSYSNPSSGTNTQQGY